MGKSQSRRFCVPYIDLDSFKFVKEAYKKLTLEYDGRLVFAAVYRFQRPIIALNDRRRLIRCMCLI